MKNHENKNKMLQSFFAAIGTFFSHLFSGAQKTWKKLSPEVQEALMYGSQVIDLINTYVNQTPDFVIQLLLEKFPNFDKEHLLTALHSASVELKIAEDINNDDLVTTIGNLQNYLASLQGDVWAKISETLAKGIAIFTAPPETKWAAISSMMEFVYQTFIKKAD